MMIKTLIQIVLACITMITGMIRVVMIRIMVARVIMIVVVFGHVSPRLVPQPPVPGVVHDHDHAVLRHGDGWLHADGAQVALLGVGVPRDERQDAAAQVLDEGPLAVVQRLVEVEVRGGEEAGGAEGAEDLVLQRLQVGLAVAALAVRGLDEVALQPEHQHDRQVLGVVRRPVPDQREPAEQRQRRDPLLLRQPVALPDAPERAQVHALAGVVAAHNEGCGLGAVRGVAAVRQDVQLEDAHASGQLVGERAAVGALELAAERAAGGFELAVVEGEIQWIN